MTEPDHNQAANPPQTAHQPTSEPLKAPFPWFGGKSKVAEIVWPRLGDVRNYIEPFCGSAAMLLRRPHAPQIETINDKDCFVANFWRATQADPDAVVAHCDHPVFEDDLHARHRWLVLSDDAAAFRERMRIDPDYFDAKIAGWWAWGQCCWIGGGWCNTKWQNAGFVEGRTADGDGTGLHAKRPKLSGQGIGTGVHSGPGHDQPEPIQQPYIKQQQPDLSGDGATGRGIHRSAGPAQIMQPHSLQPTFQGACEVRRQWLLQWFGQLRDRLRLVRVCSGDWHRVCGSRSTTTRIGVTGIFLDPPYMGTVDGQASRDTALYAEEDPLIAMAVQQYCMEHGSNPRMRIALCGYEGEHNILQQHGWIKVRWRSHGGYGNRNVNRGRERIWFSPHCLNP